MSHDSATIAGDSFISITGRSIFRIDNSYGDLSLTPVVFLIPVTADYDIPRPMNVHLTNTFPSWYKMGINAYNGQVYDVCSSGVLTAPENEDAGYSCPSAGVYNFHTSFKVPGSRRNIFASWSGYSYGVNVHFKHDTEGGDWATCHMNIKVKKNEYGGYGTTAKFLSVAGLGLASIAMGVFYRRRRERVAGQDNEGDMGDQFELVNDHAAV